jgi:hypothetical protein
MYNVSIQLEKLMNTDHLIKDLESLLVDRKQLIIDNVVINDSQACAYSVGYMERRITILIDQLKAEIAFKMVNLK